MQTFFLGVGVALAIEGVLYAAFPGVMRTVMQRVFETPESSLRTFGLISLAAGVVVVWLVGA